MFKKKESCRIRIENIIVVKEPVRLLLNRKQVEQIEQGKITNKDVFIIVLYHQLISKCWLTFIFNTICSCNR